MLVLFYCEFSFPGEPSEGGIAVLFGGIHGKEKFT